MCDQQSVVEINLTQMTKDGSANKLPLILSVPYWGFILLQICNSFSDIPNEFVS